MSGRDVPSLSVVFDLAGSFEQCRYAIGYWREQTIADEIEIVLVGPSAARMMVDEAYLAPFHGVRVVEIGEMRITGHATAAGIRAATAPFLCYGEEHGYPEPKLAEAIVARLREGYEAVGWAMKNANPGLVSQAQFCLQFCPALSPVRSGEVERLVGHHSAYRREALLAYGPLLGDMMSMENTLHLHMKEQGARFFMIGEAASRHVHMSRMRCLLDQELTTQRIFACTRMEAMGWGWGRRLLYVAGAPLIPFVRVRRGLRALARDPALYRRYMPQLVPVMFAAACAGAAGEALGYLLGGKRRAQEKAVPWELDRYAYVSASDAAAAPARAAGAGRG